MRTFRSRRQVSISRQRGVLTLTVSLAILMLSTLVTFSVANAVLMEQRIANHDLRARQAFETAEAGMLKAMNSIANDPDTDGDGSIDPLFDTDADGIGDTNTTTTDSGGISITMTDLSNDMTRVQITVQGYSDDRSATRTVSQVIVRLKPLRNAPQFPLVARERITVGGSVVVRNPEGNTTIWSGSGTDLGPTASVRTEIPQASNAAYPACMDTAMTCELVGSFSGGLPSVDIVENDSALGALSSVELFRSVFGLDAATYRASMVTIDSTPIKVYNDADLAGHEVIWVEGDTALRNSIGCTISLLGSTACPTANQKPCIVIVNGDASFAGTAHLYGLLYVNGTLGIHGSLTVHGAVVVTGKTISTAGGNLDIWYNSALLAGTSKAGKSTVSAGTWKDF